MIARVGLWDNGPSLTVFKCMDAVNLTELKNQDETKMIGPPEPSKALDVTSHYWSQEIQWALPLCVHLLIPDYIQSKA